MRLRIYLCLPLVVHAATALVPQRTSEPAPDIAGRDDDAAANLLSVRQGAPALSCPEVKPQCGTCGGSEPDFKCTTPEKFDCPCTTEPAQASGCPLETPRCLDCGGSRPGLICTSEVLVDCPCVEPACPETKPKCSDCGGEGSKCTNKEVASCDCEDDAETPSMNCPAEQPKCTDCSGEDGKCKSEELSDCLCTEPSCPEAKPKCSECGGDGSKCTNEGVEGCACEEVTGTPTTNCPSEPPRCSDCSGKDGKCTSEGVTNCPCNDGNDVVIPGGGGGGEGGGGEGGGGEGGGGEGGGGGGGGGGGEGGGGGGGGGGGDPTGEPTSQPTENPDESQCPPEGNPDQPSCSDTSCSGKDGQCQTGTKTGCKCMEDECPADGTPEQSKCSDEACAGNNDGKCTAGENKDCNCKKDECPADDAPEKPRCIDETCKGEENGRCSIGELTDCNCKQCPADNSPDQPNCSNESCVEKDGKCSKGDFKGCNCKSECPDPTITDLWCIVCGGKEEDKCKGDPNGNPPNQFQGCPCNDAPDPNAFDTPLQRLTADIEEDQKVIEDAPNQPPNEGNGDGDGGGGGGDDQNAEMPDPSCNTDEWSAVPATVFKDGLFKGFCDTINGDVNTQLTRVVNVKGEEVPATKRRRRHLFHRAPQNDQATKESEELQRYKFKLDWSPGPAGSPRDCNTAFQKMADGQCGKLDGSGDKMAYKAELDTGSGKYSYEIIAGDKRSNTVSLGPDTEPQQPPPQQPPEECKKKCTGETQVNNPDDLRGCDCRAFQPKPEEPVTPPDLDCDKICSGLSDLDDLKACKCGQ